MSVLVKGMGMPKRHLFEGFVAIGDGQIVVKNLENNKLFEGEIKEIPTPHGRLIDADAFLKWLKEFHPNDVAIMSGIKNARTIVEAEVGE